MSASMLSDVVSGVLSVGYTFHVWPCSREMSALIRWVSLTPKSIINSPSSLVALCVKQLMSIDRVDVTDGWNPMDGCVCRRNPAARADEHA